MATPQLENLPPGLPLPVGKATGKATRFGMVSGNVPRQQGNLRKPGVRVNEKPPLVPLQTSGVREMVEVREVTVEEGSMPKRVEFKKETLRDSSNTTTRVDIKSREADDVQATNLFADMFNEFCPVVRPNPTAEKPVAASMKRVLRIDYKDVDGMSDRHSDSDDSEEPFDPFNPTR
ncbi:hypothetical protein HDU97_000389 [Phlyctochytrium planicorne]|nr:hypothetical protein HDU97_000389 [Phlyctochytrium planicorne]